MVLLRCTHEYTWEQEVPGWRSRGESPAEQRHHAHYLGQLHHHSPLFFATFITPQQQLVKVKHCVLVAELLFADFRLRFSDAYLGHYLDVLVTSTIHTIQETVS